MMKVGGSTSKAENLNAALEHVNTEHVCIYDADHHPDPGSLELLTAHLQALTRYSRYTAYLNPLQPLHPGSLELLTAHLQAHDCSCVQGSTYLRRKRSLFDLYINSEFFVTHFVFFPAMQAMLLLLLLLMMMMMMMMMTMMMMMHPLRLFPRHAPPRAVPRHARYHAPPNRFMPTRHVFRHDVSPAI